MTEEQNLPRVVLADDHPVVLSGLRMLLQADRSINVIAACSNGVAALQSIRDHKPEVAVLDISMPDLTGLDVLQAVEEDQISTRVVFLTASATDDQIVTAIARGARGILLKDTAPETLLECLHKVAAGDRWLPPELVDAALEREAGRRLRGDQIEDLLTAREREVLLLVAEGLSNKEIARRINLSDGTVKIHLHNIYQKLGTPNRTAVAVLALTCRDRLLRP